MIFNVTENDSFKCDAFCQLKFENKITLKCLHVDIVLRQSKSFCSLKISDEQWIYIQRICQKHHYACSCNNYLFYQSTLSDKTKINIREEYANARKFCDDDIYWQLRFNQQRNDEAEKKRWMTRFTKSERKNVKQLLTRKSFRSIFNVLNDLLFYTDFWSILQIEIFHRIINLKCSKIEFFALLTFLLILMILKNYVIIFITFVVNETRLWKIVKNWNL